MGLKFYSPLPHLPGDFMDACIYTAKTAFNKSSIKIEDRFIHSSTGERITIVGITPSNNYEVAGDKNRYINFYVDLYTLLTPEWCPLTAPVTAGATQAQKCDCGLKFSRDGGNHSPWCSLEAKK